MAEPTEPTSPADPTPWQRKHRPEPPAPVDNSSTGSGTWWVLAVFGKIGLVG